MTTKHSRSHNNNTFTGSDGANTFNPITGKGYRIEMNRLEGFSYFWNHLWTSDTIRKPKLQILDTILFANGEPCEWIFTSSQNGEIMRKKSERLDSIKTIIEHFKKKSNHFKGYKSVDLKNKIATIWYMKDDKKTLGSYLVSEKELGAILQSKLKEIIAVQVYMGGYALKGNGIFEHRVVRQFHNTPLPTTANTTVHHLTTTGAIPTSTNSKSTAKNMPNPDIPNPKPVIVQTSTFQHQTVELLDSLNQSSLTSLTNKNCKKMIILENQHEICKNIASYLIRYLESRCQGRIDYFSFQIVFNSTWDAYFIGSKGIIFDEMTLSFLDKFDMEVYCRGIPPSLPSYYEMNNTTSSLLPHDIQPNTLISTQQGGGIFQNHTTLVGDDTMGSTTQTNNSNQEAKESLQGGGGGEGQSPAVNRTISVDSTKFYYNQNISNSNDSQSFSNPNKYRKHPISDEATDTKEPSVIADLQYLDEKSGQMISDHIEIPPIDLQAKASYFKVTNEYYSIRTDRQDIPFTADDEKIPLVLLQGKVTTPSAANLNTTTTSATAANGVGGVGGNTRASISMTPNAAMALANAAAQGTASSTNIIPFEAKGFENTMATTGGIGADAKPVDTSFAEKYMQHRNVHLKADNLAKARPVSASSLVVNSSHHRSTPNHTMQSHTQNSTNYAGETMNLTNNNSTDWLRSGPIDTTNVPNDFKRYHSPTNSYNHYMTYQGEDLDASPKPLTRFFKVRRPISAPHVQDRKARVSTLRQTQHYLNGTNQFSGAKDTDEERRQRQRLSLSRDYSYDFTAHAIQQATKDNKTELPASGPDSELPIPKDVTFWREMPMSGNTCYGEYCWFLEHCKYVMSHPLNQQFHDITLTDTHGEAQNTHYNTNLLSKNTIPDIAKIAFRSTNTPYRISNKSILLAKCETGYLGESLSAKIDSLVIRSKLAKMEIESVFTYFVRRYMNKIAQKCQEEAIKFQLTSTFPGNNKIHYASDWHDLNTVYRRVVYNEALTSVHPSRFYYSVPVCEVCYHLYVFMDQYREDMILHNPDQHIALLHSHRPTSAATNRPKSASALLNKSKKTEGGPSDQDNEEHAPESDVRGSFNSFYHIKHNGDPSRERINAAKRRSLSASTTYTPSSARSSGPGMKMKLQQEIDSFRENMTIEELKYQQSLQQMGLPAGAKGKVIPNTQYISLDQTQQKGYPNEGGQNEEFVDYQLDPNTPYLPNPTNSNHAMIAIAGGSVNGGQGAGQTKKKRAKSASSTVTVSSHASSSHYTVGYDYAPDQNYLNDKQERVLFNAILGDAAQGDRQIQNPAVLESSNAGTTASKQRPVSAAAADRSYRSRMKQLYQDSRDYGTAGSGSENENVASGPEVVEAVDEFVETNAVESGPKRPQRPATQRSHSSLGHPILTRRSDHTTRTKPEQSLGQQEEEARLMEASSRPQFTLKMEGNSFEVNISDPQPSRRTVRIAQQHQHLQQQYRYEREQEELNSFISEQQGRLQALLAQQPSSQQQQPQGNHMPLYPTISNSSLAYSSMPFCSAAPILPIAMPENNKRTKGKQQQSDARRSSVADESKNPLASYTKQAMLDLLERQELAGRGGEIILDEEAVAAVAAMDEIERAREVAMQKLAQYEEEQRLRQFQKQLYDVKQVSSPKATVSNSGSAGKLEEQIMSHLSPSKVKSLVYGPSAAAPVAPFHNSHSGNNSPNKPDQPGPILSALASKESTRGLTSTRVSFDLMTLPREEDEVEELDDPQINYSRSHHIPYPSHANSIDMSQADDSKGTEDRPKTIESKHLDSPTHKPNSNESKAEPKEAKTTTDAVNYKEQDEKSSKATSPEKSETAQAKESVSESKEGSDAKAPIILDESLYCLSKSFSDDAIATALSLQVSRSRSASASPTRDISDHNHGEPSEQELSSLNISGSILRDNQGETEAGPLSNGAAEALHLSNISHISQASGVSAVSDLSTFSQLNQPNGETTAPIPMQPLSPLASPTSTTPGNQIMDNSGNESALKVDTSGNDAERGDQLSPISPLNPSAINSMLLDEATASTTLHYSTDQEVHGPTRPKAGGASGPDSLGYLERADTINLENSLGISHDTIYTDVFRHLNPNSTKNESKYDLSADILGEDGDVGAEETEGKDIELDPEEIPIPDESDA